MLDVLIMAGIFFLVFMVWAARYATLPKDFVRDVSCAFTDTSKLPLSRLGGTTRYDNPNLSGFRLLDSGLDAFVARIILAGEAQRSIDAQYYLFHNDLTGRLFLNALLDAADRGVRVRLLIDDMALTDEMPIMGQLDRHPNMQVRVFNPFSRNVLRMPQLLTRFGAVTRRMHNKSFTVDNLVSVLGGRNIGDEYFEANPEIAFGDLDVLAVGKVVAEVSTSFDSYWNSPVVYPASVLAFKPLSRPSLDNVRTQLRDYAVAQRGSEYARALEESDLHDEICHGLNVFSWGIAELIYDSPDKVLVDRQRRELHMSLALERYFVDIHKELIIFTPYFVPGRQGIELLGAMSRQGVRVRIITNSLASNDVSVVHSGYAKYRKQLLRAGIQLFELNKKLSRRERKSKKRQVRKPASKASLHAKSFVMDRRRVFVGSLNLDPRSIYENTEIGVVFDSSDVAIDMARWFDENVRDTTFEVVLNSRNELEWHTTENGKSVTYTSEPNTSLWRRISVRLMQLLPIESQL